jgi:hypothetical protein
MIALKNGTLGAGQDSISGLRQLTRSFLSRERPAGPDRVMPWMITDGVGVTPERVDEVAYQVAEIATLLIDDMYRHRIVRGRIVENLVDPASLRDEVQAEMHCYREAVLSRVFLVDTYRDQEAATIDVCHPATALRARFSYSTSTLAAISVRSKQQGVPLLVDPTGRQPSNPLDEPTLYVGYGVGTDLYRVAASRAPRGVRWARGLTHDGSEGVRRKLHREDPLRWEISACEVPGCADGWASPSYAPRSFHEDALPAGSPVVLPARITVMKGQ